MFSKKMGVIFALSVFVFSSYSFIVTIDKDNYSDSLYSQPGDSLTKEGIALGRLLFYDSLLSVNGQQSCASCHQQAACFTDAGKDFSDGALKITGNRNSMPLINLASQQIFFWDGRAKSLEEQVLEPIQKHNEMAQNLDSLVGKLKAHPHYPKYFKRAFQIDTNAISASTISKALSQFLKTIYISPKPFVNGGFNNVSALYDTLNKTKYKIFEKMAKMCSACHSGELYRSKSGKLLTNGITYYDNDKTNDTLRFKAPMLINLAYTAPYMHDGRFKTLYEVLDYYDEHITELQKYNPDVVRKPIVNTFTKEDKKDMVEFLLSLKDTTVLTNKKYSNPFTSKNFKWADYPNFK